MTKNEKFLNVLRTVETPVTILEWTNKVVEQYPVILNQINSQTNEFITYNTLADMIKSKVSRGEFPEVKVLNSGSYSNIKYVIENKKLRKKIFKDTENRRIDENFSEQNKYRFDEFTSICNQLNKYFKLNFNLYSIESLSNNKNNGRDYIDNIQLLTKEHTLVKRNGTKRFSIEEQKAYIKRVIAVHMMVDRTIDINLTDDVLEMLLDRLEKIY